jgi:hypothetical protein
MRREILAGGLLAVLSCGTLAQTTAGDVSKKASEAWGTVRSYTAEKKDDAVTYGRKLVRDTDRQISSLEHRAASASGEAKVELEHELKELKAKRAVAAKKLDEMGKASSSAWDEAKNGFADAYKDLQRSYQRAVKKLK